jgi:hypothetical protein
MFHFTIFLKLKLTQNHEKVDEINETTEDADLELTVEQPVFINENEKQVSFY